jgi:uncharacterized membrane protein HdeD (DUF308 family)
MESILFRSWWVAALCGLLGILFAVLAIGWPGLTRLALVGLFAAYAILAGIASLAGALLLALGARMRALARAGGTGHDRRVLPDRRMSPAR